MNVFLLEAFLSSGTDGDVWLWNDDTLEDAEYEPKSALGRTHHSLAWHVSCLLHILWDYYINQINLAAIKRRSLLEKS